MSMVQDDIQLIAAAPNPVTGGQAQTIGATGIRRLYYWVVAHFPIGVSVSGPFPVINAPSVLTAMDAVRIVWDAALGATAYDVLRTDTATFPQGPGNYAVAPALPATEWVDITEALGSYNPTGLTYGAPVMRHIHLNNRDYNEPTIELDAPLKTSQVIFSDGSTISGGPLTATVTLDAQAIYALSESNGAVLVTPPPGKAIVVLGTFWKFTAGSIPFNVDPDSLLVLSVNGADGYWQNADYVVAPYFISGTADKRTSSGQGFDALRFPYSAIGQPLRLFYVGSDGIIPGAVREPRTFPTGNPRAATPITTGNGMLEVVVQYVLTEPGDAGNGIQVAQVTLDAATIRGLTATNGALLVPGVPGATIISLGIFYDYKAGSIPFTFAPADWFAIEYEGVYATPEDIDYHYVDFIYCYAGISTLGSKTGYQGGPSDGLDAVRPQFAGKALQMYARLNGNPITGGDGTLTVTIAYILDTAATSSNITIVKKTLDAATIRSLTSTNGALIYQPPLNSSAFVLGGFWRRKGTVPFAFDPEAWFVLAPDGANPKNVIYDYHKCVTFLLGEDIDISAPSGFFQGFDQHIPVVTAGKPLRLYYSYIATALINPPAIPITGGDGTLELVYLLALTPDVAPTSIQSTLDEGILLPPRTVINFVGAGVAATDDAINKRTVISIPGGGSASQTPWVSDIECTGFSLNNALNIQATGNVAAGSISAPTVVASSIIYINTPVGTAAYFGLSSGGSVRWNIGKGTGEVGGNFGGNLEIHRYSDPGDYLGTPFTIARDSGNATFLTESGIVVQQHSSPVGNCNIINIGRGGEQGIFGSGGNQCYIGAFTDHSFSIYSNAAEKIKLSPNTFDVFRTSNVNIFEDAAGVGQINIILSPVGGNQTVCGGNATFSYFGSFANIPVHLFANSVIAATVSANGYVGIGTQVPEYPLHVNSNSATVENAIRLTIPGFVFDMGLFSDNGYLWLYENLPMAFGTADTERMRISGAGNVGIGNDGTPPYLDSRNINLVVGSTVPDDSRGGTVSIIGDAWNWGTSLFFADYAVPGKDLASIQVYRPSGDPVQTGNMIFVLQDAGVMRAAMGLYPSGVGIGNLDPAAFADPTGTYTQLTVGPTTPQPRAGTITICGDAYNANMFLNFMDPALPDANKIIAWIAAYRNNEPPVKTSVMQIAVTDNGVVHNLILSQNGNLGIDLPLTTAPAYKLDVNGDCNLTGGVYRINGVPISTGGGAQTPWTNNIDGAGFNLYSLSRIAIGMPTADDLGATVHVNTPTDSSNIAFTNSSTGPDPFDGFRVGCNLDSAYLTFPHPGGDLSIVTPNVTIAMSAAGNVGIGTDISILTPAHRLLVEGDINVTGTYRINGVPISTAQTPWTSDINAAAFKLNNVASIGINRTAPTSPGAIWAATPGGATFLAVNSSSTVGGGVSLNNDVGRILRLDITPSAYSGYPDAAYLQSDASLGFIMILSGSERLHITSSGNVGIGYTYPTTNPSYKLDVAGSFNATGAIIRFSGLPSTNPGAGSKQVWYDPADANTVKFAP
jgi:hypothetical protein